jgi:hypothetical protein
MSQQSFTTSSTVSMADNAVINRGELDLIAPAQAQPQKRDFLLLCKDSNIAEAVHALYYLPQNYKLTIMADIAHGTNPDNSWVTDMSFKDRIKFETTENTETSERKESPYSFADAIISDEANAESLVTANAPYVVVSSTAAAGLAANGVNGFTVQSGNPEALASAILHIARKI